MIYQMTMRGREAKTYKLLFPTFLASDNNGLNISYEKADETFNLNMIRLFDSINFKGRYTYKLFSFAIKDSQLLMGGAGTFKYLEEDSSVINDDSKPVTAKIIKRHLKANTIDDIIACEGIRTAIRLEKAVIEWDLYDKKYGVLGQYINLLVREGCLVSKQLETKNKTTYKYKDNDNNNIDNITNIIKTTLNYDGRLKATSKSRLYTTLTKLKLGQRILSCHLSGTSNELTVTIESILTTVFQKYGFSFQTNNIALSRTDCINIYDHIVNNIYSSTNNIDPGVERLFAKGAKVSDRSKYRRITSLLKLFFNVTSVRGKRLNLSRNTALDNSIQNMTETHKRYLYN